MTAIEQSYAPAREIYVKLAILAFGLFIVGTNAFVIAGLLPQIAGSLGVTATQVSYSITFYAIVVAVVAPTISITLARTSRTTLMASGLALIALGTALAALSHNIEFFTLGRMIAGVGGAALVPSATAAATAIVPPERRGTAIAFVSAGFTLSTAVGAPLGTAIGAAGGWELPLWVLAGLAVLMVPAVALGVRGIPLAAAATFRRRITSLRDGRLTLTLFAGMFIFASFNSVYIFSSQVTHAATGGSGGLLAALLFGYGIAGIVGNAVSGPLTDAMGNRSFGVTTLGVQVVLLGLLPLLDGSFLGTMILFVVWGVTAFASTVPLQHRLVAIDPGDAAIALSWWASATYIGIAVAPLIGGGVLVNVGVTFVPEVGAALSAVGILLFLLGYRTRSGATATIVPVGAIADSSPRDRDASRRGIQQPTTVRTSTIGKASAKQVP